MSIEISHVSKFYGEQKALNDVSLNIGSGEIIGFLGPNGAGKSTMMKIITCFIPPSEGTVKVCGFDVGEEALEVRKKVGYLPEHNPLYLEMYVKEYLSFVGGIYKLNNLKSRVDDMIHRVGLEKEQHKLIGALSKGYRQRVGLAQAMIHDPEVLILDEPTSGLDPNQLVGIRELIRTIGKEKTVMLSTHIMQEVEAICNRVVIINRGNVVADEPSANLRGRTRAGAAAVTVEFDKPVELSQLRTIPGVSGVESVSNGIWKLTTVGDNDSRKVISEWAQQNDLFVLAMKREEQSLEDVFKELTNS
ncbi:MAG: gliding motility-associated ABC transporter ATP-binding subunit GldA [Cryomorphaceae bacterium]|nr:gliding motility-associated ABC transporter ATP-binding subunit GldA [Cryomorphaceae bacterium]